MKTIKGPANGHSRRDWPGPRVTFAAEGTIGRRVIQFLRSISVALSQCSSALPSMNRHMSNQLVV